MISLSHFWVADYVFIDRHDLQLVMANIKVTLNFD